MGQCLFCAIARGHAPATIRHEDDRFIAFDDIFPKSDTHVLVVPRAHHEHLDSWVDAGGSGDELLRFVVDVAAAVDAGGRYRLLTNVGRDAGQMIPHLHWHVMAGGGVAAF